MTKQKHAPVVHPNELRPIARTPPPRGLVGRVVRAIAPSLTIRKWSFVLVEFSQLGTDGPERTVRIASEWTIPADVLAHVLTPFQKRPVSTLPWAMSERVGYRQPASMELVVAEGFPVRDSLHRARSAMEECGLRPLAVASWPIATEQRAGSTTWVWRSLQGGQIVWRDTLDRQIADAEFEEFYDDESINPSTISDLLIWFDRRVNK